MPKITLELLISIIIMELQKINLQAQRLIKISQLFLERTKLIILIQL